MSHAMPELDDQRRTKVAFPMSLQVGSAERHPSTHPMMCETRPSDPTWSHGWPTITSSSSAQAFVLCSGSHIDGSQPHRRLGRLSARMDGPLKPSAAVGGRRFSVPV